MSRRIFRGTAILQVRLVVYSLLCPGRRRIAGKAATMDIRTQWRRPRGFPISKSSVVATDWKGSCSVARSMRFISIPRTTSIGHRLLSFDWVLGADIPHRCLCPADEDQKQALGDLGLGRLPALSTDVQNNFCRIATEQPGLPGVRNDQDFVRT